MSSIKLVHTKLLLQNGDLKLEGSSDAEKAITFLTEGQFAKVIALPFVKSRLSNERLIAQAEQTVNAEQLTTLIEEFASAVTDKLEGLCIAVLLLQIFLQTNYTGPKLPLSSLDGLGFIATLSKKAKEDEKFAADLQAALISYLTVGGQQAYHLADSPIFLVLSLRLFERLQGVSISLLSPESRELETEKIVDASLPAPAKSAEDASIAWWRCRALQVQQSLYPEYSSTLTVMSSSLLSSETVKQLVDTTGSPQLQCLLLLYFHLESAKCAISGNAESEAVSSILKANKASRMEFVLTGCQAKRTKYQQNAVSSLTVLAKSQDFILSQDQKEIAINPQDIQMDDDTFLDKPVYESLGSAEPSTDEAHEIKRIKLDETTDDSADIAVKLLPTVFKREDIPPDLLELDPNNQPALSNLDNLQILLRMYAVKDNTPNTPLINEQLGALLQRIIFSPAYSVNWLIFSRALWHRSFLEASKVKNAERGVMQLYTLVEELGVTSEETARLFSKTQDQASFHDEFLSLTTPDDKPLVNSMRLRYIYQLPLLPKWAMDSQLAEKLIQFGLYKNAIDIYERLDQSTDAAVCYATVGDSDNAEACIKKSVSKNPDDARAWCVLGDIKQDPALWKKSWQVGKYPAAMKSLARYYYSQKDLQKAIDCMYKCLCANPISFDNWYFYGCLGLQAKNYELAAEAFKRCTNIEADSPYAWSNLAAANIEMNRLPQAFVALDKAVNAGETGKKSWRIWENYLTVAGRLGKWNEVLHATKTLLTAKRDHGESGSLDLTVMERLIHVLTSKPYDVEKLTFFDKSCIEFVTVTVPSVADSPRCWRDIAKVNTWRNKPWLALEDYEKAYRSAANVPQLAVEAKAWDEAVESCSDLVSAYENLGELPGRHGADDVVCKDWKFKARTVVRSLMAKGKAWEQAESYNQLRQLDTELS